MDYRFILCTVWVTWTISVDNYRKIYDIRRTDHQNLNSSRVGLQSFLRNTLKPNIKWRRKMQLEQRRQAMLQLQLSYQQFIYLLECDLY